MNNPKPPAEATPNAATGHENDAAITTSPEATFEASDVNLRGILVALIGLGILIGVVLFVTGGLMALFAQQQRAGIPTPVTLIQPAATPAPLPGLWIAPEVSATDYLSQEHAALTGYGWVDRPDGIVRIPITQALQLLLANGVEARTGMTPTFGQDPSQEMESNGGSVSDQQLSGEVRSTP